MLGLVLELALSRTRKGHHGSGRNQSATGSSKSSLLKHLRVAETCNLRDLQVTRNDVAADILQVNRYCVVSTRKETRNECCLQRKVFLPGLGAGVVWGV